MTFGRLIPGFALFVSCHMFFGTLHSATQFAVSPSSLSFGDIQLGETKQLIFRLGNLQTTPLVVNISFSTSNFSVSPAGQVTLNPKEKILVTVSGPVSNRCLTYSGLVRIAAGSEQETVSLSAKRICPELSFVGSPGINLSVQDRRILTKFTVASGGTVASNKCTGQIVLDGHVVQNFEIPSLITSFPGNQKSFQLLVPTEAGAHNIQVLIDTDNQNKEYGENDNIRFGSITVP